LAAVASLSTDGTLMKQIIPPGQSFQTEYAGYTLFLIFINLIALAVLEMVRAPLGKKQQVLCTVAIGLGVHNKNIVQGRLCAFMLLLYKLMLKMANIQWQNSESFFEYDEGGRRGHSKKLFKKRTSLDVKKFLFSNRVAEKWNSLTNTFVNCTLYNGQ